MNRTKIILIPIAVFVLFLSQCRKDDKDSTEETCGIPTTERFNFSSFPYPKLSDYDFFSGEMKEQIPAEGFLPYDVITPLFTDYAHKKRFIWMPEGAQASYDGDHEVLNMPNGTIIIKTFYYDNVLPNLDTRIVETRLLYKMNGDWNFADYIWNDDQEEAIFDLDGGNTPVEFQNESDETISINYRIPSETECITCHKELNTPIPIGPKPQNLNKTMVYSDGEMNQLAKWIDVGYLEPTIPAQIETVADWKDEALPISDRVRAYIDINCGHCHKEDSHCSYRPMRFAWNETGTPENLGICTEIAETIDPLQVFVVTPGSPNKSMMYYRLNATDPSERMPLLGRSIVHEEGLQLIEEWIDEIDIICN